jgi:intracellular sulfur oxidation DsrE/DsrF family protein
MINNKDATVLPPTFAEKDLNYYLRIVKGDISEIAETQMLKSSSIPSRSNIVVLFTSDSLGNGYKGLGEKLLVMFIKSLLKQPNKPKTLIFINGAVKYVLENSVALNTLTMLNEQGVDIKVCDETLKETSSDKKLQIGTPASTDEIVEILFTAWKVITL